mmetsp:Transcript_45264/g.67240  ORF Transcript_45264/g.67240 Transcript_45264/m.67240 type:complete len:279 (+) Transcript_45264:1406-2242(+)
MSIKRITNFLELGFNGGRLVKDNKDTLFGQGTRLRIRNGLLNGCKANVAISARGTKNHAFEPSLFFGRNNSGNGRKAHVHIPSLIGIQQTLFAVASGRSGIARCQFTNRQTRSVRHEEATRLFQNFLEFHLFVVLCRELFRIRIEFLQLSFVLFEFALQMFQELSARFLLALRIHQGFVQKAVDGSSHGNFQLKILTLRCKETKTTFQFIATLDKANVATLKGSQVGVEISKLNDTLVTKISQTIMSSIFVDNQRDILHRFTTKPTSHDEMILFFFLL